MTFYVRNETLRAHCVILSIRQRFRVVKGDLRRNSIFHHNEITLLVYYYRYTGLRDVLHYYYYHHLIKLNTAEHGGG